MRLAFRQFESAQKDGENVNKLAVFQVITNVSEDSSVGSILEIKPVAFFASLE